MLTAALPNRAQADPASVSHVELAAQPLSSALSEFSRQTGIIIIAPGALTQGRTAHAIAADGTIEELLHTLLKGSSVRFERTQPNVYVLRKSTDPAGPAPSAGEYGDNGPSTVRRLDPVVVSGSYFDSLASARGRMRNAENLIDSIDAKGIGDFPAQNVAEALQRVPGVSVSRDRGEALFLNVRGLGANFQIVTLNGSSIAVNENVRDSGQDGRQFRFDMLPAELVAGVEVIKSPDASLDEGGIGAIINVRTFNPLDLPSSSLTLSASASHPDLADKTDVIVSTLGSWKNKDETIGLLGAVAFNERSLRQDRITLFEWQEFGSDIGQSDSDGMLFPESFRPTLERENRRRLGVNGVAQFRPNDKLQVELEAFYVDLEADYNELSYSAVLDQSTLEEGSATVLGSAIVEGVANAGSQIGLETSGLSHDTLFLSAFSEREEGSFLLKTKASYTRARSWTDKPITRTRVSSDDIGQVVFTIPTLYDGLPGVQFLDADLEDPTTLAFRRIEYRKQESRDTEIAAQIDLEHAITFGPFTAFDMGYKFRQRERGYDRSDRLFTNQSGVHFPADYYTAFPVNDFLSKEQGDLVRSWMAPNPDTFAAAAGFVPDFNEPTAADLRNSYKITEQIQSVYAMGRFDSQIEGADIRGNAGLRVSRTYQVSSGHIATGDLALPVSYANEYIDVLPSANLVVAWSDAYTTRATIARVITRPSLADLAPRITLNSSELVKDGVGGNPNLKRYQAWQADLGAEYTPTYASMLSANLFVKRFDTFVFDQISDIDIDGETYQLTAPANGGNAEVHGVELAYQQKLDLLPEPWNGLGVQANYTWTRSKADYSPDNQDSLANVADHSYSISGIYEHGPISARVVYNRVGDVFTAVGTNSDLSTNTAAFGTVDASLSYRLTDGLDLTFEAQNLTEEAQYEFVKGGYFAGYTQYGRTFAMSLRYRPGLIERTRQPLW